MKSKLVFLSLLLLVFASIALPIVVAQDEEVRGAFLTTRPKTTPLARNKPRPSHRRPKAEPTPTPGKTGGTTSGASKKPAPLARMGIGLTLFMRDSNGLAVRVDPSHTFTKGDHVRFLLETNADGFLYIFNTTDGGPATMIYPDPELDEAGNYVQAHVPFELPSSLASEERLRWLTFDEHPGVERLYFVFTREPLTGAPIEDDLLSFCKNNAGKCPWHPSAELWTQLEKESNDPAQSSRVVSAGTTQTAKEKSAVVRGIGLNRNDPEPSLIMLNASSGKTILVTTLDLNHNAISLL